MITEIQKQTTEIEDQWFHLNNDLNKQKRESIQITEIITIISIMSVFFLVV